MGYPMDVIPAEGCGFRPVCTINPESITEEIGDGMYRIVPFVTKAEAVCTDEDLFTLLGLSLP
jgi:hypothetical protein